MSGRTSSLTKLPPIPSSPAGRGNVASGSAVNDVNLALQKASTECGDLLQMLVEQTVTVQTRLREKLQVTFAEAIRRLQEEWSLEQRAAEQKMAAMAADMEKMKAAHQALQQREKELQETHSVLIAREQALVEQQSRLSIQLSAEQKSKQQNQKDLSAQHKTEMSQLKEDYSKQISQLESTNDEQKKKLQQLTAQLRQLREQNSQLNTQVKDEEIQRRKAEQQRRDEQSTQSTANRKLTSEISKLKNELSALQQQCSKLTVEKGQLENRLRHVQSEHADSLKKVNSQHSATVATLNSKLEALENELTSVRLHYQAEIEKLRKELAEKMHASLDTWLGAADDIMTRRLRQQNREEKGKLEMERANLATRRKTAKLTT